MRKVKTNRRNRIFSLFAMFAMAIGVGVSLAPREIVKTSASSETLEIKTSDFSTTSYADNNKEREVKIGGVDYGWESNQVYQNSSAMQWQKDKGAIWSTTPMGSKITSIEITASTSLTYLTVYFGNTLKPTSGNVSPVGNVYTPTGSNAYFHIKTGTLSKTTLIKVNFETGGSPVTIEGISVKEDTVPDKLDYYAGETFDPNGVIIEASLSDDTKSDVTDLATYTPSPLPLGQTTVTVTYEGHQTTIYGLTVIAPDFTTVTQDFDDYENEITSGIIDSKWNWVGVKGTANTDTRTWDGHLRIYSGGAFVIEPTPTNTDYRMIGVEFKTTNANIGYSTYYGMTSDAETLITTTSSVSGATEVYSNPAGFRHFAIKATGTLRVDDLVVKYKEFPAEYDPITSVTSNFTNESIKIGESVTIEPTILPAGANQGFALTTQSDKVQIVGATIKGLAVASNVKVLLTTVGKNANDEVVTEELTFNVVQATTTVAEALTLPVSDIVYLVEDAKVSNGFNTQYDRQIELVDSVDPSKKILVFEYGIQAIESYDYIAGGTITFKAKLSAYLGVNQFVQPEIIDYTDRVEEFASSIMTGDVEGQCVTRFDDYKIDVLAFTEIEMTKLEESSKEVIVNALARYQAWALHMGEKPFEAGKVSDNSSQFVNPNESINSINATLIIGVIGLTTLAGYYFLQRKQKQI